MSFKIGKVHHLNIAVPNLENAVKFYTEVLGFEVTDRFVGGGMEFVFITDGNIVYELLENKSLDTAKFEHIAYCSEDINADYNYFKQLDGAMLEGEIGFIDFLFENGVYYFFITGSGGERIEFCQKKE